MNSSPSFLCVHFDHLINKRFKIGRAWHGELERLQFTWYRTCLTVCDRIRKLVSEMLELQNRPADEERDKELSLKIQQLSKHLPEPVKAHEFLRKFSAHMSKDPSLLSAMETVMNPGVSCKQCSEIMVSTWDVEIRSVRKPWNVHLILLMNFRS